MQVVRPHAARARRRDALPARAVRVHPEHRAARRRLRRPRQADALREPLRHAAPALGPTPAVEGRVRPDAAEDERAAGARRTAPSRTSRSLSEALNTDLFAALRGMVPIIKATTVSHCVAQDPTTHRCTQTATYDGVHVLSEAVRALVDPARAAAVGSSIATATRRTRRNDGTTNPQVTPIDLLIDALKGIDAAWSAEIAATNGDTTKHAAWHDARSSWSTTFLLRERHGHVVGVRERALHDARARPPRRDPRRPRRALSDGAHRRDVRLGAHPARPGARRPSSTGRRSRRRSDLVDAIRIERGGAPAARVALAVPPRVDRRDRAAGDDHRGARRPAALRGRREPRAAPPRDGPGRGRDAREQSEPGGRAVDGRRARRGAGARAREGRRTRAAPSSATRRSTPTGRSRR